MATHPFLDKPARFVLPPPPFLAKIYRTPKSINFGKVESPLMKGGVVRTMEAAIKIKLDLKQGFPPLIS